MNPAGKNCTVTRTGRLWDAILVTDDGFGALMCQKRAQSQIRLGEWGRGGYHWGGGVGEPRTLIIYIYIYISLSLSLFIYIYILLYFIQGSETPGSKFEIESLGCAALRAKGS